MKTAFNAPAHLAAHPTPEMRIDRLRNQRDRLVARLMALIDCHEERCDGKPGYPCPHPKKARALLAEIEKEKT